MLARTAWRTGTPTHRYERAAGRVFELRQTAVIWVLVVAGSVLAVVWLVYPLCTGAMAAILRPSRARGMPDLVGVSVIVASADAPEPIRARVLDLLGGSYPPERLEVIVALDRVSARASAAELEGFDERVTVVLGDAPGGKAPALNAAVRAARHNILVFTDTAQRFEPTAIAELVASLADPRFGIVSGSLVIQGRHDGHTLADRYWHYERWLREREARLHSAVGVTGAIYAMRRELWQPLPAGLILDDLYTPMRLVMAGWRVGFNSRARAYDARRFTPVQEYRRKVRTLTGVIQLCAWLPAVLNPIRNPIWFQFVFHKLLRLLTPYLVVLSVVALLWEGTWALVASGRASLLIGACVAAGVALLIRPVRRTAFAQLAWVWALQTSAIAATVNGVRGRWDVWK